MRSRPSILATGIAVLAFAGLSAVLSAETVEVTLSQGTNMALDVSPDAEHLVIDLQGTLWVLDIAGGEARAITDHLGDARQPAWSPDGKRIAFQSYRDGNWHIWTIQPDGNRLTQVTSGPVDDREPHWSPDSASLVFSSDRGGNYDIWQVDLASGDLYQRTTNAANDYAPAWSPLGDVVAFVSEREPSGLWVLEGGEPRSDPEIKLLSSLPGSLAGPSWSTDGSNLSVQSFDRAQGTTTLLVATGQDQGWRAISSGREDVFPFRAAWLSPKELIYTAEGEIWRVAFAPGPQGTTERQSSSVAAAQASLVTADSPLVRARWPIPFLARVQLDRHEYALKARDFDSDEPRPALGILNPSVSPDGAKVVFMALGDLWLFQPPAAPMRLTDDAFIENQPAWSPDGEQIAYVCDREGEMDIWVRDLTSGADRRLTASPGAESNPAFSPNGRSLAFFAADPASPLGGILTLLDLETNQTEAVHTTGMPPAPISWTTDGAIAVAGLRPDSTRFREGTYQIAVFSKEGTRSIDPVPEQTLLGAVFSPDGRSLAFVQDGVLKVADIEHGAGTAVRRLTDHLAHSPSWTGDSRRIVYQSADRLMSVAAEGGAATDLGLELSWSPDQPHSRLVVHAGRLFDGRAPTLRHNIDIVIDRNRISRVRRHTDSLHPGDPRSDSNPEGWIDASDYTVLPGLFDMHAHQGAARGEVLGRTWLAFGITSVREPGADAYDALERRESWASGRRLGPREFFAGPLFDGNRVYYAMAEGTSSPQHVDRVLERAEKLDYDLIKTYVRLPDPVQRRVASAAHALGIRTSSHEIFPASSYGMDAVEHVGATSRRGYSPKVSQLGHSYQDVIQLLARSGMNQTPTLVLPGYFTRVGERPGLLDNRQFEAFYGNQREALLQRASAFSRGATGMRVKAQGATPAAIVRAGGRVTAGTDSPFVPYGFGLHVELQLLQEGGLEPWEVLRSATLWAAEAVGVGDDLGSIEEGKLADLTIVRGNPLSDIEDTLRVVTTIKNGVVYSLDELLRSPR